MKKNILLILAVLFITALVSGCYNEGHGGGQQSGKPGLQINVK